MIFISDCFIINPNTTRPPCIDSCQCFPITLMSDITRKPCSISLNAKPHYPARLRKTKKTLYTWRIFVYKTKFLTDFFIEARRIAMSRMCEICGKKPMVGNNVSHAHNLTKRRFNPNLQHVRTISNGRVKRMVVCTNCIKSGSVVKAP